MILGIDFSEIILICLLALVVLGPEKLIRVASCCGKLVGKFQSHLANIKFAFNNSQELSELKTQLNEVKQLRSLNLRSNISNITKAPENLFNNLGEDGRIYLKGSSQIYGKPKSNLSSQPINVTQDARYEVIPQTYKHNHSKYTYYQPELNLSEQPELFD